MAGLVFLLVFWVLAGACQRHGAGRFLVQLTITICTASTTTGAQLFHRIHRR